MLPVTRRCWPFLGLFAFLWIVPATFGFFGFACHKGEPDVPTEPGTPEENGQNFEALSEPVPSPSTFGWAGALVPLLAVVGVLVGRLRGERV